MNYLGENKATLKLLSNKQIIENFIRNVKKYEVQDNNFVLKPILHKDALKATITLHNFLIGPKNTIPELFNALKMVKDEVLRDNINFKEKTSSIGIIFYKGS